MSISPHSFYLYFIVILFLASYSVNASDTVEIGPPSATIQREPEANVSIGRGITAPIGKAASTTSSTGSIAVEVPRVIGSLGLPIVAPWEIAQREMEGEDVIDLLTASGWNQVAVVIQIQPDLLYDVWRQSITPGRVEFLVIPIGGGTPVGFRSPNTIVHGNAASTGGNQTSIALGRGANSARGIPTNGGELVEIGLMETTAEAIREELMRQIEAALKTMCEMPARPKTVRAKASTLILEVEGTWDTAEACTDE